MSDILIRNMALPKNGRLTLQIGADGAVYIVDRFQYTGETYLMGSPAIQIGKIIDYTLADIEEPFS